MLSFLKDGGAKARASASGGWIRDSFREALGVLTLQASKGHDGGEPFRLPDALIDEHGEVFSVLQGDGKTAVCTLCLAKCVFGPREEAALDADAGITDADLEERFADGSAVVAAVGFYVEPAGMPGAAAVDTLSDDMASPEASSGESAILTLDSLINGSLPLQRRCLRLSVKAAAAAARAVRTEEDVPGRVPPRMDEIAGAAEPVEAKAGSGSSAPAKRTKTSRDLEAGAASAITASHLATAAPPAGARRKTRGGARGGGTTRGK